MAERRKQHLNINSGQMEMATADLGPVALSEDFDSKMVEAQKQLELLQSRQEEIERQKVELASLNSQKQELLNGQIEMSEKLSSALTAIDRELFEMQQEVEDLQQTRECFAQHLERIDRVNPEAWAPESLATELHKSIETLHHADDEFNQAMQHFSDGRSRGIFGGSTSTIQKRKKTASTTNSEESDFVHHFKKGLAFNLPMVMAIVLFLIAYLTK